MNTLEFLKSKNWNSYIDYDKNDLRDDLKYAEYACLTRNRDLDGNGIIDDNELRWYLPSVKQYLGFIMGEDALPKEARLYNRSNSGSNSDYSYITSSIYPKYYVLQAYEGASLGFHEKNVVYPYRCIRNLRSVGGESQTYVVLSNKDYPDRTAHSYSLERLNAKAKRNNINGALTFGHRTFEEENRLPGAFDVGDWVDNKEESITAYLASWTNPCIGKGDGWRIPNQKELAVIVYNRVQDDGMDIGRSYFSCTRSASGSLYCGYDHTKPSMTAWDGNTTTLSELKDHNPSEKFIGYRCIKDK